MQCVMEKETGQPTDQLAPVAEKMIETLGSFSSTVSGVIVSRDRAVFTAITEGLERVNSLAPTDTHKVCDLWLECLHVKFVSS